MKKPRSFFSPFVIAMALLAMAAFSSFLPAAPAPAQAVPLSGAQIQLSFTPVVKAVSPAVVNIYTKRVVKERAAFAPFLNDPFFRQFSGPARERVERSLGSGVIVQADGTIVTAHHVIKDAQAITVVLSDRREFEATIVKRDPLTDLAVLKISVKEPLPFLTLRDSDAVEVGELTLAVGNPFGIGQTVTQGIVSAVARTAAGVSDYQFFIQTDAAVNPGNSGGALVDMAGRLIGVNTAIFSTTGGSLGVGFAIPSNMVKAVLAGDVKEGVVVRPWLGARVQPVTAEMADSLGLSTPRGVIVRRVDEGGPAEKAGIRVGDVILSAAGAPVDDEASLQFRVGTGKVGGALPLTLLRKGKEQAVSVTLAAPREAKLQAETLGGNHPLAGITVTTLTPAAVEIMELSPGPDGKTQGVLVLAGNAVLANGDIIVQVNGKPTASVAQLEKLMAASKRNWQIIIRRGDQLLNITINL